MQPPSPDQCLAATPLVDSDHPDVRAFAQRHGQGATRREQAVSLYYAVRDGFRYDPYRLDLGAQGMRASSVLSLGYGWCVTKAALLAAAARASGIPARLGFADVRNHLSTQRMRDTMQTDVFIWHGYTDLWLEGAWRKATPAFNVELCDRFGLHPLEFDGLQDSIYHPFDKSGQRHMEYLQDRGSYAEMPLERIVADFRAVYPGWLHAAGVRSELHGSDFLQDVAKEPGPAL
ncbi:transglutaminase family protein [Ramlibacter sp. USB13]|uniref:Transglutaminase family protein n=1 Tax=Ramlibacter cellulosilyticus TaxID=2764187 RepID=A0A923SAY4_9BURK|nr:transglutaminase family protein [Ramlibacter cellulosilyticus]MBC5783266.1 transglutaminase family protein [Ramlibacter cellulosilyticus]